MNILCISNSIVHKKKPIIFMCLKFSKATQATAQKGIAYVFKWSLIFDVSESKENVVSLCGVPSNFK